MSDDILEEFDRRVVGRFGLDPHRVRTSDYTRNSRSRRQKLLNNRHGAKGTPAKPTLPRVKWLARPDPEGAP